MLFTNNSWAIYETLMGNTAKINLIFDSIANYFSIASFVSLSSIIYWIYLFFWKAVLLNQRHIHSLQASKKMLFNPKRVSEVLFEILFLLRCSWLTSTSRSPGNFHDIFQKCPCLFPGAKRERLAQDHPTGFMPMFRARTREWRQIYTS